jgi:hypothetical protein
MEQYFPHPCRTAEGFTLNDFVQILQFTNTIEDIVGNLKEL